VIRSLDMADEKRERAALQAEAESTEEPRTVHLAAGRTLTVTGDVEQVLELRNPGGLLELRIKLTDEGPVLQVEGAKVALKATEAVSVECKTFEVRAEERVELHSEGSLDVTSEKELRVKSTDDVRVNGKIIHLN
jgi:hypothetical protein